MRRAIAIATLFGIILAMIVLIFASLIFAGIGPDGYADSSLCTGVSTGLRLFSWFDEVTVATGDEGGVLELCPPRHIEIASRESDDAVNKRIGDELVLCQKSFGGGNINLFRSEGRLTETTYCGLCSKIEFEEGDDRPIEGFEEHLATYVVPGTEQTIGQILNAGLPPTSGVELLESGEIGEDEALSLSFDRSEDYAVLFVYMKQTALADNVFEAAAYGALMGTGIAARPGVQVGRAIAAVNPVLGAKIFGPMGALASVAAGAAAGAVSVALAESTYTDDYAGGVVMIPWDALISEDLDVESPDGPDGLYKDLGCDIPVGFT